MPSVIQRSFAGGEVAPALFGRADQTKYQTGLKTCRNFLVQRFGGVSNRPGTQFIREVKDSTKRVRLVKFIFNASQTYVLEFGEYYIRIHQNGALLGPGTVTAWSSLTAYTLGDLASSGGVNYYCLRDHTNQAPPSADFWAAMPAGVLEIPTPYTIDQVRAFNYVQSADVVTIASRSHEVRQLRREAAAKWSFGVMETRPDVEPPSTVKVITGTAGAKVWKYAVTAITDRGIESLPGVSDVATYPAKTITGASVIAESKTFSRDDPSGRAKPSSVTRRKIYRVRIASAAHGFTSGMSVLINEVSGMTQINGRIFKITVIDADNFELDNVENADKFGAYTGGGTVRIAGGTGTGGTPTASNPNVITWDRVVGAKEYSVYREDNERFVYIGSCGGTRFEDANITADATTGVPYMPNLFNAPDSYPGAVSIVQQRLCFGGTNNRPETVWMSRTADYHNFSTRTPLQDDDSVVFTIAGRQVNEVRHLVEIDRLLVLTSGGEWVVQGDQDGVISPTTLNLKQIGYSGASNVPPVVIGNSALFVQARGSLVRDLRFEVNADGYQGRDLTVYAPHLFDGFQLEAMDYAQTPHSISWAVRDDGVLLGLTYLREHEIWGWHRHDTGDGDAFEDVCVVPEGNEDAVYFVVRRTIGGATKRYIERFASRRVVTVATDAKFLDSHLTYNGTNATATTLTLTGGSAWSYTEDLTLIASASTFTAGDVGNAFVLTNGADTVTCRVIAYTSGTALTVQANKTVPASLRGVARLTWSRAADVMSGLGHLEGRTVSILADGDVHPQRVVTGGQVELDRPYSVVHVGLPIIADMETLPLEVVQGETITDRKKRVNRVTILQDSSRGGFVGQGGDEGAVLREIPQRTGFSANGPVPLVTGAEDITISTDWNQTGGVLVRQTDPLPLTILAIVPSGIVAQ